MIHPGGSPTSFLQSMQRVRPHLAALEAAGRQPVRVTRARCTVDGWVIAFRAGDGRERAVAVDARDGSLRGVEPALAGSAWPKALDHMPFTEAQ